MGAHIDDDPKPELKSGIVGVVTNIHQDLQSPPMPEMDWLIDAIPPKSRIDSLRNMYLMVRTNGDPRALTPSLRATLHDVDSTVPFRAFSMEDVVKEKLILERMESWLFGIFAGVALLLAVIGIYGLISHEVELRTREIGIRMALGSTRASVIAQVLRRVAVLILCVTAAGWALALASRKVISSVITVHGAQDVAMLAGVSVALAVVGLLTSLAPAREVASIDPMQALRMD